MPGAGYEGVTRFVLDVMTSYGPNASAAAGWRGRSDLLLKRHCYRKALMRPDRFA